MRITISDEVYESLSAHARAAKITPDLLIERQLARFAGYPVTQRLVILTRDSLHQIELLLGGGQIQSPEALVARVRSHATVSFGEVDLALSPAEKEEIQHRAQKQGKAVQQVLEDLAAQLKESMFHETIPYR